MATLSETGRRQPALLSHTAHQAKFANVVALGSEVVPDFQPTVSSAGSAEDSGKSAPTSAEQTLPICTENIMPTSNNSSTDQATSDTFSDLRPSSGTDIEAEGIQLDNREVDEDLDDEGLRELQTDYERRKEERKKEQDLAVLERQRLEEILRICSEYDQQQEAQEDSNKAQPAVDERRDSSSRSSWGSSTKIKTNGSLTSSGLYSRRSDDEFASSIENYVIEAAKQSNRDAEPHPYVTSTVHLTNRVAQSDPIQSRSAETGSDRTAGKSYARILKLSGGDLMESNNWDMSTGFQARIPSKDSDQSDVFKLFSADLSDGIDDDNVSTDCFQEESTFSVVSNDPSEHSFQTTSPTLNGNQNRYDGNGNILYVPRETLSKRPENENSRWNSSKTAPEHHPRGIRYQKSVEDVKERIQVLRLRLIDIKNLEEKTIAETQSELELLQWEYSTLIEQLEREKDRMAVINHQQMELLFEAAKERDEAERQLESERRRLDELEGRLDETRKRCLSLGIDPDDDLTLKESALGELIVKEMEEVEHQRHLFDDLEFHLLEMETRREEEREPQQRKLTADLNQLKHSCSLVEETLLQLNEQKFSLISQVKSDVIDLEKERLLLVEDFRKEKKKLSCLLNECGINVDFSQANRILPLSVGHLQAPPYTSKATQRSEKTEFKEDAGDSDEEFLPKTPSSTTSVLRRLQELEYKDPALKKFTENKDPGVTDGEDELGVADDQSFQSSSFSVDRLKSWLETDQSPDSKIRFYSGSDEGASVRSAEDDLEWLLMQNADRYSYGTGCSSQSKEQPDGKDSTDQSSSDGHLYIKNRTSSAERATSGTWRWSRAAAAADTSDDNRSAQPTDNGTATYAVVLRTKPKTQSRPMTRYLPVRGSCDLDLRQFIESSGHRVDGNPHIHLTPSTCRGYLVKMGTKFRLWHRRWFLFDRTRRCVVYYADQSAKKVRGCVQFSAIEDVFVDHLRTVRSPSPKLTFCLKTAVKNFYLVAPSPETMRIWIDVLFTGAEGYQGFS